MATRIQSLFLVQAAFTCANTEDWFDSIAFFDAAGAPIPLDGISFTAVAKAGRDDGNAAYLGLASLGASLALPAGVPRGLFLTSGNILGIYAPFATMPRRPLPGGFVFDALAAADGITRRVIDGSLTLIKGTG